MTRSSGDDTTGGESPLSSRANNQVVPRPLVWLVALVIGKGIVLGTLGMAWCWGAPDPVERRGVCTDLLPGLVEQHGRTVELVIGLAAGAGLAYKH